MLLLACKGECCLLLFYTYLHRKAVSSVQSQDKKKDSVTEYTLEQLRDKAKMFIIY